MWIFFWLLFAAGILVIGCAVYDWFDRKKRGRPEAGWKYALAIMLALILMLPVGYTFIYDFLIRPLLSYLYA